MFKLVNRSRSMRNSPGGGAGSGSGTTSTGLESHGREALVPDEQGPVSSPTHTAAAASTGEGQSKPSSTVQNGSSPSSPPKEPPPLSIAEAEVSYGRRPLPPTPSRTTQPSAMERPSTSAGPNSANPSSFSKTTFNSKRMSRDDMYINTKSTTKSGFRSYHIPIRGKPPSPSRSPRSQSPEATTYVRTQTPDSMDGRGAAPNGVIGVALGSPGYSLPTARIQSGWKPQVTRQNSETTDESTAASNPSLTKQKSGRWRLFSRRGRKTADNQPTPEPSSIASTPSLRPQTSAGVSASPRLERSGTERKTPLFKPIIIPSQTDLATIPPNVRSARDDLALIDSPSLGSQADGKESKSLSRKASMRSLRGLRKSDISAPIPIAKVPLPAMPTFTPNGLLDVKIPDVKMERYSIMFNSILQPNGVAPSSSAASSQPNLLARRQATLDKLKAINDAIAREVEAERMGRPFPPRQSSLRAESPPRRTASPPRQAEIPSQRVGMPSRQVPQVPPQATAPLGRNSSPSPPKSPVFSLFPPPPGSNGKNPSAPPDNTGVSPPSRARSNTTSANRGSPVRSEFPLERGSQDRPRVRPTVTSSGPREASSQLASRTRQAVISQQDADIPIVFRADDIRDQQAAQATYPTRGAPTQAQVPMGFAQTTSEAVPMTLQKQAVVAPSVPIGANSARSATNATNAIPAPLRLNRGRGPTSQAPAAQPQRPQQQQRQRSASRGRATVSERPEPSGLATAARPQETQPAGLIGVASSGNPATTSNGQSRIPQPIQTNPVNFGPNTSALILDSPVSDEEKKRAYNRDQMKPSIPEPTWQMISPPMSTSSSSTSSYRKRSPSTSSVQTHVTKPSIDEPDVLLKSAVEVSIARQISISRQQRQLLQPSKATIPAAMPTMGRPNARDPRLASAPGATGINNTSATTSSKSPPRKVTVGRNERLVDTKKSIPRLINPGEKIDTSAQYRKSERIVLERAG